MMPTQDIVRIAALSLCVALSVQCTVTFAQAEKFYWVNGNAFPFRIVEADNFELKYEEKKGTSVIRRSIDRENVIVAFNAYGMYLIIDKLATDSEDARNMLRKFYSTQGPGTDVLIKASPLTVIPATIRIEDDAVNYLNEQGQAASVNKNELVAIIYKNGEHQLLRDPVEAKSLLEAALPGVAEISRKSASKVVGTPARSEQPRVVREPPQTAPTAAKSTLTVEQRQQYQQQALKKVELFGDYLQVIANKEFSMAERDAAIRNALKLFLPGTEIQVSSKGRKTISKQPVETYLRRLKMLPYGNVQIKWSNIEFVQDLAQTSDGSYEGRIVGSQTFTGFSEKGNSVLYSDVTKKDVKVKLKSYEKESEGQRQTDWSLLLGNIGVVENE